MRGLLLCVQSPYMLKKTGFVHTCQWTQLYENMILCMIYCQDIVNFSYLQQ